MKILLALRIVGMVMLLAPAAKAAEEQTHTNHVTFGYFNVDLPEDNYINPAIKYCYGLQLVARASRP